MRLLFASLFLLAACAPQPRVEASRPALDGIELHINSWGKTYSTWHIAPDGTGIYTYADGPGLGTRLITRKVASGPEGFVRVRALLAPVEQAAAMPPKCGERWYDLPYGSVSWLAGAQKASLVFDMGCQNPKAKLLHDAVGKANKQMETWAKTGEIIADREME